MAKPRLRRGKNQPSTTTGRQASVKRKLLEALKKMDKGEVEQARALCVQARELDGSDRVTNLVLSIFSEEHRTNRREELVRKISHVTNAPTPTTV